MTTDATRPNIVFILADDLGWADLSVYGQADFETPNLDRLAGEGVRFTQAYANSAVCSATRFALMTGRYQYRLPGGLEEPLTGRRNFGLPPEHATLASLMRDAGYATALLGKWHLGHLPEFSPLLSGYDHFFGNFGGGIDYFTHKPPRGPKGSRDLYENDVPVYRAGYYTYLLADEAEKYIAQRATNEAPFLLSLHFTAPHWPWEGPEDEAVARDLDDLFHYDGGNLKVYAEMVKALDASVGRVLAALDENGMRDNTIVVFTSDNGGERFSKTWPFIGQKSELLEGGIRVPTLMRWPARLSPQVSDQVTITMDWLPTLLAAADVSPSTDYPLDGEDILPVLEGRAAEHERTLYWRYKANGQRAARDGQWKYLKINDNEFLFDVVDDVRERANLRWKHPDVFERLQAQWLAWDSDMLPISEDVFSVSPTPDVQADRYTSDRKTRG